MNQSVRKLPSLPLNMGSELNIGHILLAIGKLVPKQIEQVLDQQKEHGARFGEIALRLGYIDQRDIELVLARQFAYPYLHAGEGAYPAELIAAYQPFSAQMEILRAVRNQLMSLWFDAGHKTLLVASVNPGEGASFFAANLALVFSQLGRQTLLIDANLRTPRLHEIFNLPEGLGLSNILAGRAGAECCCKVDGFGDLVVLPAGTIPPNPQELLARSGLEALNSSLTNRFDTILLDGCAFATAADSLAVAARVGGVLLVVKRHHTQLADIEAVKNQLARAGAVLVGTVLVDY